MALGARTAAALGALALGGLWASATGALAAVPNDSFFSLQWSAGNTGQQIPFQDSTEKLGPPEKGTPGIDDRALAAWRLGTGSRSVVVGVLDSGVQYSHPDLAANIWSNPGGLNGCPAGSHGFDAIGKTCNPWDEDESYGGHGTHVAGVIGAVGNNGLGVAGVAWQASILPVKWVQSAASETGALPDALRWLLKAREGGVNIRVVNDSLTYFGTPYSEEVKRTIEALGKQNVLFVTAAGNTGDNDDEEPVRRYPCGYGLPNEICVTATNNRGELPAWANYGPHTVDLSAPGVSIYSTLREDSYGYLTGGSMASAEVAGAAALILSANQGLTAAQVKARILAGIDRLPSLEGKVISGGTLDICRAIPGCEAPTVATLAATSVTQTSATLGATVNPNGSEVSDCFFEYGTTVSYGSTAACSPAPGSGTSSVAVAAPVGGLTASTTYHFRVVAKSAGGSAEGADLQFTSSAAVGQPQGPPPSSGGQPGTGAGGVAGSHAHAERSLSVLPALLGRSLRAGVAGALRVSLACPPGFERCAGTLLLRVWLPARHGSGGPGKPVKLVPVKAASAPFAIAPGNSSAIVLRLSLAARRMLARAHRLRGEVILAAPGLAGGSPGAAPAVSLRASVTLRRGK
jgi:subtilisin family serine protease